MKPPGAADPQSGRSWPPAAQWQRMLVAAAGYGLSVKLCAAFGPDALPWLPAAVALIVVARWGPAMTLGIAGAGVLLALGPRGDPATLAALVAGDLAGAAVGARVLQYGRRPADSAERPGAIAQVLAAVLAAAVLGGIARAALAALLPAAAAQAPQPWAAFGLRALGLALAAPAGLLCSTEALQQSIHSRTRRGLNLAAALAVCAAAAAMMLLPGTAAFATLALTVLFGGLLGLAAASAGIVVAGPLASIAALGLNMMALAGLGAFAHSPQAAWWFAAACSAVVLEVHVFTAGRLASERRWVGALGDAGFGAAEWRVGDDRGRASPAWHKLSGSDSPLLSDWLARVHDEDRPALRQAIDRLVAGAEQRLQREVRVRADGGWRWLEAQWMAAERDRHGLARRLIATLSDAGARHDALDRQRLSANLFQHVQEGLLIVDADMRVLDANPAFTQILGVPRDELIGTVPSMLRPAPADPLLRQQRLLMWSGLRTHGLWRGEIVERRRSGQPCTLQATISTVPADDGGVRCHVLVISDITEQKQQRDQLERQAHFDELTRLPNRTRLMELLAQSMQAADQDGCLLAVCYLDLDRFKPVNDRFGHAAGDRLLVELAGRLRGALRSTDYWSDAAGRIGGDEFVLLLRAGSTEEVRLAVERVLRVIAQPYAIDAEADAVQVTASIGVTVYPIDRSDADTLMRHADHAMYGAKQAGRNGYQLFDPENRRRNEERVMAIGRVQEALDNGEFVLHYQPKVDMRRGVVLGLEALLRWDHPQQGLVAPAQFLPLIENTGLSARIGDWVLAQALDHLAGWRRAGLDLSVSVNVSARHLQEGDFALRLAELLARHGDGPLAGALELEILETAAHSDLEAASAKIAQCRALGVRFALDDFGTGYSTLTYLKQLPVDVLKIDRSFVHHMLDDNQDRAIVEGVIGLARTFECTVVAEGVESPAQARALLEMGCHIGQGTGIAAPMPASVVAGWVRDYRGLFVLSAAAAARGNAAGHG